MRENIPPTHFRLKKIIGRGGGSNPRPLEKKLRPNALGKVVFKLVETRRIWYQSIPRTVLQFPLSGTKIPQNPGKKLWPKNLAKNSFFAHCAKGVAGKLAHRFFPYTTADHASNELSLAPIENH
jgi:hypothetical protein